MKKNIFYFILGAIIFGGIGTVLAATLLATDVAYTPEDNTWEVNNVQEAIDDLYSKIEIFDNISWNYMYKSSTIQTFTVPVTGKYKIEVWGAQGGSNAYLGPFPGGYGGYSVGVVQLTKGDNLYIVVGGAGLDSPGTTSGASNVGGYNGGGTGWASGGGATHVALVTGTLSEIGYANFVTNNNGIIVAGGGGGSAIGRGGDGGGAIANNGINPSGYDVAGHGGTQTEAGVGNGGSGSFGVGGNGANAASSGAGGGLYGGSGGRDPGPWSAIGAGAGGSGYIASSTLKSTSKVTKMMYCYGCSESSDPDTYTVSTTGNSELKDTTNCPDGYSSDPISKCAKAGNGYAKITYVG